MESHISHIFADLFTSRPKAYSKKGLRQLLRLRLLKTNNKNIKEMYLNTLRKKEAKQTSAPRFNNNDNIQYNSSEIFKFLYRDNGINFI